MPHHILRAAFVATLLLIPRLAGAQETGIRVCDDFIAKYEVCVTAKIPAQAQAEFSKALVEWRTQWKVLAADPNNAMILTGICNQMQQQSKATLNSYGCAF